MADWYIKHDSANILPINKSYGMKENEKIKLVFFWQKYKEFPISGK